MNIFFIGELGINHNGDIEIAKKLIKAAKEAGCAAVKFQKRTIDLVYSKEQLDTPLESPWGNTRRDQKLGLELGQKDFEDIDEFCKALDIEWFASAWDVESQDFLKQFDSKYNKIASAMLVNSDFLKKVADEGKHTFISTGMSTLTDIGTFTTPPMPSFDVVSMSFPVCSSWALIPLSKLSSRQEK